MQKMTQNKFKGNNHHNMPNYRTNMTTKLLIEYEVYEYGMMAMHVNLKWKVFTESASQNSTSKKPLRYGFSINQGCIKNMTLN